MVKILGHTDKGARREVKSTFGFGIGAIGRIGPIAGEEL